MDKMLTAQGVANRLFATEAAIDDALAQASQLMSEMLAGRQELRIAATVNEDAVSQVATSIAAMTQARVAMVAAHRELEEVKLRLGIRTKMIGGFAKESALAPVTEVTAIDRRAI